MPVTPTYIPLATLTLGGNDSQVVFSNIPNTYRDLILIFNGKGTSGENFVLTLNGSSSNFSWAQIVGTSSNSGTNTSIGSISTDDTTASFEFFDYAKTNKYKSFTAKTGYSSSDIRLLTGTWSDLAAITSISLQIRLGYSFTTGSTFSLYGVHG